MSYDPIKQGTKAAQPSRDMREWAYDSERDRQEMQRVNQVSRHLECTIAHARELLAKSDRTLDHLRRLRRVEQHDTLAGRIETEPKGTAHFDAAVEAADEASIDERPERRGPTFSEAMVGLLLSGFVTVGILWSVFG